MNHQTRTQNARERCAQCECGSLVWKINQQIELRMMGG